MYSILFWKSWSPREQFFFWFLSTLLLISMLLLWRGWSEYPAPAIGYDHYQQLQSIETPSHSFSVGLINLTVPADSYVVFENIFGSPLKFNAFASYFFLSTLVTAFVFFMSVVPSLSRYRFLISMGIAILFLASLQVESLEVFGLTNRIATGILILIYGLIAFYFHAFKSEASFTQRLLVFFAVTALLGFAISNFSQPTYALLHLSANGLFAGILVCLLFIVIVSHEIVASFVTIISRSLKSTKSLQHFLILSSIYLVNVFLVFASKMGFIDWSFFSVSPFFLIAVSGVLGIWGFRQREPIHEGILNEEPLRLYFFLSLALVAFGAMTYFMSSASDIMIDALEDLIIAAHFGGGLIFVLYVIANFSPLLAKNLPVYKVLYKPDTMPHFTFRLMGVIATFAVLSWAVSWKTYLNQMVGTFYNAHADVYLAKGEVEAAEAFYLKSLQFRNQNLHAHYGLATIYAATQESIKERKEYAKAIEWTPNVQLYLNLSRTYPHVLESALTLDEGKKKFPKSGELLNEAALAFVKLKLPDSAMYYFRKAEGYKMTKDVAATNLLAASATFHLDATVDSVMNLNDVGANGIKANALAIANLRKHKIVTEGKFSNDTSLNLYQAMALSNYLINQKETVDTLLVRNAINLSRKVSNELFAEQLLIASVHALYAQGQVREALQIVRDATLNTGSASYATLMGLWLLEQNNPAMAASYFKVGVEKKQTHALYYQAIAETEADSLKLALNDWDSLRRNTDKGVVAFAEKMFKVLNTKPEQATNLADDEKYYFARYKIALTDKALFEKVTGGIAEDRLRAQAIIDRSRKWFAIDELQEAASLLNQLNAVYSRNINQQIAYLKLMMAEANGDWLYVQKNMGAVEMPENRKIYFEALLSQQSGNRADAQQKFTYLIKADNQFEEGVAAASRFLAGDTTNQLKSLTILVEGLLARPNSVKILKQHALLATSLGFLDAAQDSLNKLRSILPDAAFKKFVAAHPDYFGKM